MPLRSQSTQSLAHEINLAFAIRMKEVKYSRGEEINNNNKKKQDTCIYHSEGDQPWDFFGRNDAKAETPVLWPPHVKS